MPSIRMLCCAACVLFLAFPAQGAVDNLVVTGDEASADLVLPGGIAAELTLRFESAVGLNAGALGLSVEVANPLSGELQTLLPGSGAVSLKSAFPMLLIVAAPAEGGLAFEGVVELELYTRNLGYTPGTTLRLFSSSGGEAFRDISEAVAGGSYRVRGSSGQFSKFLIVADERPLGDIVEAKFARLNSLLSAHSGAIDPAVASSLNLLASTAYTSWQGNDPGAAIAQLRQLGDAVETAAAAGLLPNVWQSTRDVDNVAGYLRATARTLAFSLGLALAETS